MPREAAPRKTRLHRPCEFVLTAGVGHFPQVERPAEFQRHLAALVEAWLGDAADAPQR